MNHEKGKTITIAILFLFLIIIVGIIFFTARHDGMSQKLYSSYSPNGNSEIMDSEMMDIEKAVIPDIEKSDNSANLPVRIDEESLLTIIQDAAGCEMETYVYVDMDHDGFKELIGACSNGGAGYLTWYCSSDGKTCCLIQEHNIDAETCTLKLIELDHETHVVINTYNMIGNGKRYTIIALKDSAIACLLSNKYGYVYMTESGDIILDVEYYDAMYDPDGGLRGHTWYDTYLYFDGETYKEYGAIEITEAEYSCYENAQVLKDMIANELEQPDTVKLEYSYFVRKNNIMYIQCDRYDDSVEIYYGYYTVRFADGILDDQLGEYMEGRMAPYFSDLDVTY